MCMYYIETQIHLAAPAEDGNYDYALLEVWF